MKAIHAVNAVLWQPGEQIHKLRTNKPNDYYTRGRPHAPRVNGRECSERRAEMFHLLGHLARLSVLICVPEDGLEVNVVARGIAECTSV